nr:MAG TPA_asm: hypothetical protein [Caudoviricetes sp.]
MSAQEILFGRSFITNNLLKRDDLIVFFYVKI